MVPWPGYEAGQPPSIETGSSVFTHSGPFSAGRHYGVCWSGRMQMGGHQRCKQMVNSMHLHNLDERDEFQGFCCAINTDMLTNAVPVSP